MVNADTLRAREVAIWAKLCRTDNVSVAMVYNLDAIFPKEYLPKQSLIGHVKTMLSPQYEHITLHDENVTSVHDVEVFVLRSKLQIMEGMHTTFQNN